MVPIQESPSPVLADGQEMPEAMVTVTMLGCWGAQIPAKANAFVPWACHSHLQSLGQAHTKV
jgi:hypothetical protein